MFATLSTGTHARRVGTLLASLGATCVLAAMGSGCHSSPHPKPACAQPAPDTLVVVASRLWESRTYQDFLEPLAAPNVVRWINASDLPLDSLLPALAEADGVLMTGGADIHPARYLQRADTARCGAIDASRDSLEAHLLAWVDARHTPCLGICRGMQFMNVHGGGSLHPHLPDVLHSDAHRAGREGDSRDTLHTVRATRSWAAGIALGDRSEVVSHHHQGVDRLAERLEVWAVAQDGLVEGVRERDTLTYPFYVGVQWHPERSLKGQPLVDLVGRAFVSAMQAQDEAQAP